MKFIKAILVVLSICVTSVCSVDAQNMNPEALKQPARLGKRNRIATSVMECLYEHFTYDPVLDQSLIEDEMLEIGRDVSHYLYYSNYKCDSILTDCYPNGLSKGEYYKIVARVRDECGQFKLDEMLKDSNNNKNTVYATILMDHYVYDEEIPRIEWRLVDGVSEVCGHLCRKAEAEFRGRTWTAWYAEAIQIDNGPWKFGGLPGLILKVEDSKKEHIFEAIQIRKGNRKFGYLVHSFNIKTDRKKFNKMRLDYKVNAANFLSGSQNVPTKLDGSSALPKRRMFYNPIELD